MGTIFHRRVVEAKGGADRGELAVEADWVTPDGKTLLREQTRYVFRGTADSRTIDRTTTLTALADKVVFQDSKEGFLGIRVARALEQPAERPDVYTDATGKPAPRAVNNVGVSGLYVSSEGLKGDAVWSTRGRWVLLGGTVESEPVTMAILDHPSNPGYPTHWHARGYGLFAANPLGDKEFGAGEQRVQPDARAGPVEDLPLPRPDPQQRSGARENRGGVARLREGSGREDRVNCQSNATNSQAPG